MWINYSLQNLKRKKSYSLFFLTNFSISLIAIFSLFLFQSGIENYISSNAKQLMTGEISISARRDLTQKEQELLKQKILPHASRDSFLITAYSMMYAKDNARLVLIKAVDQNFPLFGRIGFGENSFYEAKEPGEIFGSNKIWVYPELLVQLNLSVGDEIQLGQKTFQITKVIEKDVGVGGFGSALAPAIYMSIDNLKETELLGFGSNAWYTRFFDIKNDALIKDYVTQWNKLLDDPAVRIQTYHNANQQIGRLQGYLGDYLGLVALVCLLLSMVGAYYLFRSHLVEQAKSIALLEVNGAGAHWILKVFSLQIFVLSLIAGGFSLLVSVSMSSYWERLIQLGEEFSNLQIPFLPVLGMFVFLLVFVLFSMLPLAWKFIHMDKSSSLMESKNWDWDFKPKDLFIFLPSFLCFVFLSVYISKSYVVGSIFVAVILFAILATYFAYRIIIFLGEKCSPKKFQSKYIFRHLQRDSFGSVSVLFALGLSFLLMQLVPQLERSLRKELLFPKNNLLPDLFLFDIQDEQVGPLKDILKEEELTLKFLSPMVRSRLVKVNSVEFEKPLALSGAMTREEEREKRFRNRGFNLSYRESLSSSETLVEGSFPQEVFDPSKQKYPDISIEKRFMERLDLKMGDVLSFDLQGVIFEGKITSVRNVKWTSFQPNFFLLFQRGVLEDAPKTFLAALGDLSKEQKQNIQNKIVKQIPNVSIVDVQSVVLRILDIFEKMAFAISVLALFSFVTGLFMVFVIANTRSKERKKDFLYLRLFGASSKKLIQMFQWEFIFIVSTAFLLSLGFSYLLCYFLVAYVFDAVLEFYWPLPLGLFVLSVLISSMLAYFASRKILTKEEYGELLVH
jgi:putative ABC transport system permease protein